MGIYFLIGQAIKWSKLDFGLRTGLVGATFYLLTGFHGLHVLTGVLLQLLMFACSSIRGNYDRGYPGVSMTVLFWHFEGWDLDYSFLAAYLWRA